MNERKQMMWRAILRKNPQLREKLRQEVSEKRREQYRRSQKINDGMPPSSRTPRPLQKLKE